MLSLLNIIILIKSDADQVKALKNTVGNKSVMDTLIKHGEVYKIYQPT